MGTVCSARRTAASEAVCVTESFCTRSLLRAVPTGPPQLLSSREAYENLAKRLINGSVEAAIPVLKRSPVLW